MALIKRHQQYLNKIAELVDKISHEATKAGVSVRKRRSRAEVSKMRKDILAARAKGVSATKLAEKYGVSSAYIYMIKR